MGYGNSGIATDQSNKAAVGESNYEAVYHSPNASNLAITDSTANGNNSSNNSVSVTSGIVGSAVSYNGSSQYTFIANPGNFDFEYSQPLSVEFWMKKPRDQSHNQMI